MVYYINNIAVNETFNTVCDELQMIDEFKLTDVKDFVINGIKKMVAFIIKKAKDLVNLVKRAIVKFTSKDFHEKRDIDHMYDDFDEKVNSYKDDIQNKVRDLYSIINNNDNVQQCDQKAKKVMEDANNELNKMYDDFEAKIAEKTKKISDSKLLDDKTKQELYDYIKKPDVYEGYTKDWENINNQRDHNRKFSINSARKFKKYRDDIKKHFH